MELEKQTKLTPAQIKQLKAEREKAIKERQIVRK